jgi:uncharacterized protein YuzE
MVNRVEESIDWAEVTKQNSDLGERLTKDGLYITYDEDGDTLLVTIGKGGHATTEQVLDDIFIRIHPETLKIQGCVIISFQADFLKHNKLVRALSPDFIDTIKARGGTLSFRGKEAQKARPYFEAAIAKR